MRLSELDDELAWYGYHLTRMRGSHRVYRNRDGQTVIVAPHGRDVRPDVVARVRQDMHRHARITGQRLLDYLHELRTVGGARCDDVG